MKNDLFSDTEKNKRFKLPSVLHNAYRLDYKGIAKHSEKALLVVLFDFEEVWIPRSQILEQEDYGEEGGVLTISEWLAEQKGFTVLS